MIQNLVKRSGETVPFDNNKANHLIEWAEENMAGRGNITQALHDAIREMPETVTSSEFNNGLISKLIDQRSWPAYMMAGRIYAFETRKVIYGKEMPTLLGLHTEMVKDGRLLRMDYHLGEYQQMQEMLQHDRDLHTPEFALNQMRNKYALKNMYTGKEYETPQFTYMRMAMALAEDEPKDVRMKLVFDFYDAFSQKKLSAPTPNYTNLGTKLRGYASCCLFAVDDTNESIRAALLIANDMTCNSAGLGMNLELRSAGDPVRGGAFIHRGKKPYFDTFGKLTIQNVKNGRDGAMTAFFSAFDPEAAKISQYRSPLTPTDGQNRDIHFAMQLNKLLVQKAARNEDIFVFNKFTAPDLYEAIFSGDIKAFAALYEKYDKDEVFKKTYVKARQIIAFSYAEAFDTGTAYLAFMDEINRHTPNKEPVRTSNLCLEVTNPVKAYEALHWMYDPTDHGKGEISMCNLAAHAVSNIDIDNDEEMFKIAYLSLRMIDKTIMIGEYPYPHLEFTAKQRMNAGVGMMGVATLMARRGLKYSSIEGKKFLHRLAERHMYFLIKASIAISKERGLAPWMHKTKWPEGWVPTHTYNRGVDEITDFVNSCDWDALSQEIIENGGIGHCSLANYMPGESSSKGLALPNSVYPVRDLIMLKRDGTNVIDFAAEDGDILGDKYELAFDISNYDMIDVYGIFQKWTDQAISADLWKRFEPGQPIVPMKDIIKELVHMVKRGLKTRYYQNSRRPAGEKLDHFKIAQAYNIMLEPDAIGSMPSIPEMPNGISVPAPQQGTRMIMTAADAPVTYVDNVVVDNCDGFCKM